MTVAKAIIKAAPDGIDVKVGYDEKDATDEEKSLAVELSFVIDEYLRLKQRIAK